MDTFEQMKKVRECYKVCPFFGTDGTSMDCLHPSRNKDRRVIITKENSIGRVPKDCPWQN